MRLAIFSLITLALQVPGPSTPASFVDAAFDGDPVGLSTGLYSRSDDDINVPGTPLTLTRTYRTRDDGKRPFGIGTSHSYHLYLFGDAENFQWADLILEDGGRIHFRRISPGRTRDDALFEHTESPTEFYGSQLQWNGNGWNIDLRDRGRYTFSVINPSGKDQCRQTSRRDADGTELQFEYDAAGDLTRIRSAGGWITLAYDASHRIVRASSSSGVSVKYEYDEAGHLTRVATSGGRIQEYAYGSHHEVRSIREPDRLIENTYDAALRCVKQVITFGWRGEPPRPDPDVYTFSYRLNVGGKIVETKVIEPDSTVRIATFNVNGYLVTDTTDPTGPRFTQVIYARDDVTNLAPRVTVRCMVAGQMVEAFALVGQYEHPDTVRGQLLARTCQ